MEEREKIERVKNLNKFQKAAARRAFLNEKPSLRQLHKIEDKLAKLEEEKTNLVTGIEGFDAPIKIFTGGIGAEETVRILDMLKNGEIDETVEETPCPAVEAMQEAAQTDSDDLPFPIEEIPVTTEEAVKEMPEWMKIAEEELK